MFEKKMNVIEHLGEMRRRIMIVLLTFIFFFCISFYFVETIYQFLVRDLPFKLALLGPSDVLYVYFLLAGVSALALSIPIVAYQAWLFVKPGLTKQEQKLAFTYIPLLFILFLLGICFGYFVLFPIIMSFLQDLSDGVFQSFYTTDKYFRFLLQMTLPLGIVFELPVVIMFLTSLGIVNPHSLRKMRKVSYFILIIISVFITPPDFITDIIVLVPLILLYECSISLSSKVYKRKIAKDNIVNLEVV